ncbi:hypothetical protein ACFP2T_16415 [Plantactinospora solaniradicis]|uniref:Uncharacterized protein n=1 Tax=Plantactinospora solaniradicis TaxID=1723736 RepID=A0ABW1K872_9ACTN
MIDLGGWLRALVGGSIQSIYLGGDERRQVVARWVAEHGIDPDEVPADARIETDLRRETLTVEVFVRDSGGQLVLRGPNELMRTTVTVPLRSRAP